MPAFNELQVRPSWLTVTATHAFHASRSSPVRSPGVSSTMPRLKTVSAVGERVGAARTLEMEGVRRKAMVRSGNCMVIVA